MTRDEILAALDHPMAAQERTAAGIPVCVTVDTGRTRYIRHGYVHGVSRGVPGSNIFGPTVVLATPALERFASSSIPAVSVAAIRLVSAHTVEAHPGRMTLGPGEHA